MLVDLVVVLGAINQHGLVVELGDVCWGKVLLNLKERFGLGGEGQLSTSDKADNSSSQQLITTAFNAVNRQIECQQCLYLVHGQLKVGNLVGWAQPSNVNVVGLELMNETAKGHAIVEGLGQVGDGHLRNNQ